MPSSDQSLAELRRRIDEIDAALQDLLIERTSLVAEIRQAKADGGPAMRPGREAEILRRLMARHRGPFPRPVVARIWREIFAVFNALQGDFAIAVYAPREERALAGLARDHFGSLTPITSYETAHGVLRAVTAAKATVGVLPIPSEGEPHPWWPSLARGDGSEPRIVACLPFAAMRPNNSLRPEGLVVGTRMHEPSGDDRSFLILECAEGISRSALQRLLGLTGFDEPQVRSGRDDGDSHLYLVEVGGFVAESDPRLAQVLAGSPDRIRGIWVAGSFAVPLADTLADFAPAGEGEPSLAGSGGRAGSASP